MVNSSIPLRLGDIRKQNERLILDMFFEQEYVSQSEAVTATGLKPSTILNIFNNLIDFGDILLCKNVPEKVPNTKKGRRPVYYCINPDAHYVIGLSADEKEVALVCMNFGLEIIYRSNVILPEYIDADYLIDEMRHLVENAIVETKIKKEKLLGAGFCFPGTFDVRGHKLLWYPYIKDLVQKNILAELQASFDFPIFIDSGTRASATYLERYGKCRDLNSFLLISLTSTVEAAFFSSETSETEQNAFIELLNIGHIPLEQNLNSCICGKKGCLDANISTPAMIQDFMQFKTIEDINQISETIQSMGMAYDLFNLKAKLLSDYIYFLYIMLQPKDVVIMTENENLSKLFVKQCEKVLNEDNHYLNPFNNKLPKLIPALYNLHNQARFAVDLVLDDFFGTPLLPWSRPWKLPGILK